MIFDWAAYIKTAIMLGSYDLSFGSVAEIMGIMFIVSNLNAAQFAVSH